jgi:hypothetical protein
VKAAFASSKVPSSKFAASEIIEQLQASEDSGSSAIIVFASPDYDHKGLLESLNANFPETAIVGSSSAGEFTKGDVAAGVVCLGLSGEDVDFQTAVGTGLRL